MKKIVYIIIFIATIGLSFAFFVSRAGQDPGLAKEIDTLLEQGETQINLTVLTDFKWTQVDVFGPYTTDEVIEDSMSIKFKGDSGGIELLEDRFLLVFANEKRAVKTVVLSRKHGTLTIKDNKLLNVEQ